MSNASPGWKRLETRLQSLYGARAQEALIRIEASVERLREAGLTATDHLWDQRDVVLITYGDQVASPDGNPLRTLRQFLADQELRALINTVHFLPCFPYSSDDGFSVVDYLRIDPALGTWEDVDAFASDGQLMLDFVVNHISQHSEWFQRYLRGDTPYDAYFIEATPETDLSAVTRPRSLPLLSDFNTSRGKRWLWTTFSRDQLDLNYAEPAVLAEMVDVLLEYVRHGARIVRLDAIAYLWKQIGTNCIHLPQTHEVVKVFRDVLETVAPHVLVLTETNVPHEENVSYFGAGDEAHMVYQFSLPPLLLDAFLNEDALPIKTWLANLQRPPRGSTYFNFTASHDGVGVRPLEGHVDDARLHSLVSKIRARGGLVSTRRQSDGTDTPYELNIAYVDALAGEQSDSAHHARRFLASQAVMLSLQGVPAIYFHSLVGTQNDLEGVRVSDIPRRINRRKFERAELERCLAEEGSLQQRIFAGMQQLLRVRIAQPAFHPDASQHYVESGSPQVLSFERHAEHEGQAILVAVNFGDGPATIPVPQAYHGAADLLESGVATDEGNVSLAAAQIVWLEAKM